MSSGIIAFYIAMGWTLLITGGLTYLILKKKQYSLISGFNNKSKEEQEQLIENGYPQAVGKLLMYTWILLFASVLLQLFGVPYGFEVGMSLFLIVLLVGMVYVQKYNLIDQRKKYAIIVGIVSIFVFALIVGLGYLGFQDENPTVENGELKIRGMYGVNWPIEEIDEVKLLEELPEVELKTNGFAAFNRLKGEFRLDEPYGKGKLFVYKGYSPYLYIRKGDDFIILNSKDPEKVYELKEQF